MAKRKKGRGGKRIVPVEKRCTGVRADGKECGAPRKKGTLFCQGHQSQRPELSAAGEVVSLAERQEQKRTEYETGRMTKEEYADWLLGIMRGETTETFQTSQGAVQEREASARDKLTAGREYRMLMNWDNAPRGEGAIRSAVADIVADILGA